MHDDQNIYHPGYMYTFTVRDLDPSIRREVIMATHNLF